VKAVRLYGRVHAKALSAKDYAFSPVLFGYLSHASYYLGSGGEAVIIDPQRDVDQYIEQAAANGELAIYAFQSDFANRKYVVEILALPQEKDGKWTITNYFPQ